MPKPRIVQALCGPARHCIMALAYEPGITAAQADAFSDVTLTEDTAADYLRGVIDELIAYNAINPWCELCRAPRAHWVFDDRRTRFATMDEAMKEARRSERDQLATQQFLRGSRG